MRRFSYRVFEIAEKLRGRINAREKKLIAGPRAGNIEQMPFRLVNLIEFGFVGDGLDTLLQGQYVVVAGHNDHRLVFYPTQTTGSVVMRTDLRSLP
jgi:hypothetical protein